MGELSATVELMLPVQNKCSNTNALRGVNKQTDSRDVEQRQTENPRMSGFFFFRVFFVKKQSLFLLFWNGMANLIECSFKIVSWSRDIFGTLCCTLRGGWHGRRECSGFAEKEIEKKQNTRSQISWNNSCDRNGERRGSTETKHDFLLGPQKKETEKDKYIRAITNGPLCRQFNLHTVVGSKYCFCEIIIVSWAWPVRAEIWFRFLWVQCSTLLNCSSAPFLPRFSRGKSFSFLFVKREFKPSVASWIRSMCLWPLCFMVTCQGFCARGRNLLQTSTAVLYQAFRSRVKGLLAGAVISGLLLRVNTHREAHNTHARVVKLTS